MASFHSACIGAAIVLAILAFVMGKVGAPDTYGSILIDNRGRYNLTHFQIVGWTLVILSSMIAVLIAAKFDPTGLKLPNELLGLMGIVSGAAVLAAAVKGNKDTGPSKVARLGAEVQNIDGTKTKVRPHFAQLWMEEEGKRGDSTISITKYQNFIFTLVALGVYVVMAWKQGGMPTLPDNVVALIGISHAGYVGGTLPDEK